MLPGGDVSDILPDSRGQVWPERGLHAGYVGGDRGLSQLIELDQLVVVGWGLALGQRYRRRASCGLL